METTFEPTLLRLREAIARGTDEDRRAARLDVAKIDPSELPEDARLVLTELETRLSLALDEHGHLVEGASPEPTLAKIEELVDVLGREGA
jgi:hypothetical protein